MKNIFFKPVLTYSFKYLYLRYGFPSFGLGKGMEAKFNMAQNPNGVTNQNVFYLTNYINPSVM